MAVIICEFEFFLQMTDVCFIVPFDVKDPAAKIERAYAKSVKNSGGVNETVGTLIVRDRVSEHYSPPVVRYAIVLRMTGTRMAEIPPEAGALVGSFASGQGRHMWHVFAQKEKSEAPKLPQSRASSPLPSKAEGGKPPAASETAP